MARKSKKQIPISFGDEFDIQSDFFQLDQIIEDRGSKYTVTGGRVTNREETKKFLTQLKKDKRFAKATHNTWSARIRKDGAMFETKNDDGETGAGGVVLSQLQKQNIVNVIIVVTRWYGGVKLFADRFAHVQNATKRWCEEVKK